MTRAAVLTAAGRPMSVQDVDLPAPGPGQARVRVAAAGVCHSDLSLARGVLAQPVPAVLGHEGSGTVVEVGAGVTEVAAGDRVVLDWAPACRACWFCEHGEPHLCEHAADRAATPYASLHAAGGRRGAELYAGLGTAAFATETVVPARGLVPLPDDVPLEEAALLGCAVLTGVGAVLRTAALRPGESVLVVGLGGVGLSAVQGARIAAAAAVIVVDPDEAKRDLAVRMGATAALAPSAKLGREVRALTGGRGADVAVECVGRPETLRSAWGATRRGGRTVLVGIGGRDDRIEFGMLELFHFARSLTGCVYGSSDPGRDLPELIGHWRAGRLDLSGLVTTRVGLGGLDSALDRMAAGRGARTLVVPEEDA